MLKKKVKKGEEKKYDVSGITLEGEAEVKVPVYDNCDEIRRKVKAYLREPGVTQAGFLREIAKTYLDGRKIQSKVLNDFLTKKGPGAGNRSAVYYSSYVFFEKIRVRDDKPKSKHRMDMERIYAEDGGMDTKSAGPSYYRSNLREGQCGKDDFQQARPDIIRKFTVPRLLYTTQ